jgi:hypothetical protein
MSATCAAALLTLVLLLAAEGKAGSFKDVSLDAGKNVNVNAIQIYRN